MGHHHTHQDKQSDLSFEAKLKRLLEHWIKHNDDHVQSYEDWVEKARAENFSEVALLIEEAAHMTGVITEKFKEAVKSIEA